MERRGEGVVLITRHGGKEFLSNGREEPDTPEQNKTADIRIMPQHGICLYRSPWVTWWYPGWRLVEGCSEMRRDQTSRFCPNLQLGAAFNCKLVHNCEGSKTGVRVSEDGQTSPSSHTRRDYRRTEPKHTQKRQAVTKNLRPRGPHS